MDKLKLAYFGTPGFSAQFLENLLTQIAIKHLIAIELVVTQPDRPVGRKQALTPSPVKKIAEKYNLPVITDLKMFNVKNSVFNEIDLALIYFYGQIIPKQLLSTPNYGFWNIHFSLLPKLRGPTPAVYSLILGDRNTGVSLMQTDEKMDHGNLIAQVEVAIKPDETKVELEERLHNHGLNLFIEQINNLLHNKIKFTPQDHSKTTYTRFPTKADGFIPLAVLKKALNNESITFEELPKIIFEYIKKYNLISNWKLELGNSAKIIYNYFRGLYPWPGIWTLVKITETPHFAKASRGKEKRLKITGADLIDGRFVIRKVQLEGKKEVNFSTFNQAYRIF
ncbi:hypothetical protein A2774_06065 [Candidatus Roizmanbacteria bacterium RIFCSPHIGHO2_01_FULL_39_12c]|uniref:methionyl-tRNA formyltransferase n=1 Tax=Candidatus Roizmanbacteria bacterium RIFCSPHIGHO2_01_FULL_39_12c TaxID=1802031 RepID=A0A1F7G9G1_9BACT|nr:MAG: hypothetical protein A2774_06065 [Candidatus Roizmanbacteria bacterium RIFCSPHIGHO2_01_FULL_39_12c]OGK47251.1 MAG: hypothetical protein A2963_04260 [Candidatus Roizmanbacteria bacterium RIFCSPLOWO2_01_FULL_40_13]